ncbi:hypothetical protein ACQJBY_035636 [Aegilops geniculata]
MSAESAQNMRWAAEGTRYRPGIAIHPSDAEAWKDFVKRYPYKAGKKDSVAIAVTTDGFNPFGMTNATYSCWPVFVIPMNLPPGFCMKRQNMFLSLVIPGPGYPGKKMSLYLEPLVDDLIVAWDKGIQTYNALTKKHFDMYVWYFTSLHDLPARAIFCGWCVHGKWPCPVCMQNLTFYWLKKGGKFTCFDKHRPFLRPDHPFRRDKKNFKKGKVIDAPPPPVMTGHMIKAQLDALQPNANGSGFVGYGETHNWTHIPCLWKLPYFQDLLLPHNIDVMHTEKNIAEALFGTIFDTEKTKDNVKARLDQEKLCDRPSLNMIKPGPRRKGWRKPPAPFCPVRKHRKVMMQWVLDKLRFSDGYAGNIMKGVNMSTLRIGGLKSHDYHVWLERVMPVMIRGYVSEEIWRVLAELSYFFRQLCAKELDPKVIEMLEKQAPELLCKLERIFPPSFFNPMQHMILHLPSQARLGGPVQYRWMYAPERENKNLRAKCKNKCRIEASIVEAYLNEEVSNNTTKYYDPNIPTQHNPVLRYNVITPADLPPLSIFAGVGGGASGRRPRHIKHRDWTTIMSYVLTNMPEVQPYIDEFTLECWNLERPPTEEERERIFKKGGKGNGGFIPWFAAKAKRDPMRADLKDFATGFTCSAKKLKAYDVNGYRFHTHSYDMSRPGQKTINSGVVTPGTDGLQYYGRIEEMIQLDYGLGNRLNPVVFRCHWFDPTRVRRYPDIGWVEIQWAYKYDGDDVYILANQAKQVFYLPYACQTVKYLNGWDVVYNVPTHNKPAAPIDEDFQRINPNTYEGEFYQEDGLTGEFSIHLPTDEDDMEEDDEEDEDEGMEAGDEPNNDEIIEDPMDLNLLERVRLGEEDEPDGPPPDYTPEWWDDMCDSDDETLGPTNDPNDEDYDF